MTKKYYLIFFHPVSLFFILTLVQNLVSKESFPRIGYLTSWKVKCGIASYAERCYESLNRLGYTIQVYPNNIAPTELLASLRDDKIELLHIQYEKVLYNFTPDQFASLIKIIKRRGTKVVVTLHSIPQAFKSIIKEADQCISHKKSDEFTAYAAKINVVPIGVPVFKPLTSRGDLRKKYGFNSHQKILSTFGFMYKWREQPLVLEMLIHLLKQHTDYHVQLLTGKGSFCPDCQEVENDTRAIIKKYNMESQITFITSYLTENEINERLYLSDLGYLWCGLNASSASSSIKQFVAARLPTVVPDCGYFAGSTEGMIISALDKKDFIKKIKQSLSGNNLSMNRITLENTYTKLNYDALVLKHLNIYSKALGKKI